jgi:hypothetical protein
MHSRRTSVRLLLASLVLTVAACQDTQTPLEPEIPEAASAAVSHSPQQLAGWYGRSVAEVMALPQTVFANHDEATGELVFGVEHAGVARGVAQVLARQGVPASAYRVEVTPPIHFAATLRDVHRPTFGGIQIHFGNYLCTLGFNVDHSGGRSFITNSHCTNQQGGTEGTTYYQPTSTAASTAIGVEADDPTYFKGGQCSRGKVCRYSDAARVLYNSGTESSRGVIAKTTGVNSGSLDIDGSFSIGEQDNTSTSFSGTIQKVGRTTGWTQGTVSQTCARVNVSGSNIQLICQTLVQHSTDTIVAGGDSGSPVFTTSGSGTKLVGILWGGSTDGRLFVFSPLKNIQDELGGLVATASGSGGGGDGGGNDGGDCVPRGKSGNCN